MAAAPLALLLAATLSAHPVDQAITALESGDAATAKRILLSAVAAEPQSAEARTWLGLSELKLGEHAEAEENFHQAAALPARHAVTRLRLAVALGEFGAGEESREVLEDAARLAPGNAEVQHEVGATLGRSGNFKLARHYLDAATRLAPTNAGFAYDLALAAQKDRDASAAIAAYRRVIAIDPAYRAAYTNLGAIYLELKYADSARDAFSRALELEPGNGRTRFGLAMALELGRDRKRAHQEAERALASGFDGAAMRSFLGIAARDEGNLAAAEASFRAALIADPRHAEARRELIQLRLAANDPAGARALLAGREEDIASDPELAVLAARVYKAAGDSALAEGAYRQALARNPRHKDALYALAQLLLADPKREAEGAEVLKRFQAVDAEAQAREEQSSRASAAFQAGRDLFEKGDAAAAATRFEECIRIDPTHVSARVALANARLRSGDAAGAERTAREAIAARPTEASAHTALGRAQGALGDRDGAIASLRRAVDLEPLSNPIQDVYAAALLDAGRTDEAERVVREVLARNPGDDEAARLLKAIATRRPPAATKH